MGQGWFWVIRLLAARNKPLSPFWPTPSKPLLCSTIFLFDCRHSLLFPKVSGFRSAQTSTIAVTFWASFFVRNPTARTNGSDHDFAFHLGGRCLIDGRRTGGDQFVAFLLLNSMADRSRVPHKTASREAHKRVKFAWQSSPQGQAFGGGNPHGEIVGQTSLLTTAARRDDGCRPRWCIRAGNLHAAFGVLALLLGSLILLLVRMRVHIRLG